MKLRGGERVTVKISQRPPLRAEAESIPLDVLYEDEYLALINKPPDMVVHPAKGHWSGTLVNRVHENFS